ncbi:MAG TPA: HD domain-containing protein [Patescibacteria group bacterium]|nr:HD domain-containing protein [Patescibacteria group bacterium]
MRKKDLAAITNFIYEAGILSKTPRSGLWYLGSGEQSVAEHSLRCAYIGYALAYLTSGADREKVVMMCLFHDFAEARTSDLNHMHQKYGRLAEARAMDDIAKSVPFGKTIRALYRERDERKTVEAKIAKDADQLEWIATMREEEIKGNTKALMWAKLTYKRLKTKAGKDVGKYLLTTHPDDWWFDAKDQWWVNPHVVKKKDGKNT